MSVLGITSRQWFVMACIAAPLKAGLGVLLLTLPGWRDVPEQNILAALEFILAAMWIVLAVVIKVKGHLQ